MDILIEKVTELGVDLIQPVLTSRTVVTRLSMPRLQAHAREAAEQCGRLTVPDISEPVSLDQFLESVGQARRILWCDESGDSVSISKAVAGLDASDRDVPWSLLIGPEGGFDPSERTLIAGNKAVMGVDLGPRVLRSETAAIVALGLWHSLIGTV